MISLKEALKLSQNDIIELKKELNEKAKKEAKIGAYVEQFLGRDLDDVDYIGVPIAIKDNIQVKGWNISCGSKMLQGYIAPYNATVIENMKKNGFAPYGRCNMDEFAMGSTTATSFYGTTLNPLNHEHVPGGSSGGSAAAVSAKLALASLGSDTGGSVRQPAAFCGCVGFKPSYGTVSRYGLSSYSSSLDQIGTLTRNVDDASVLFDAIMGADPLDSTSIQEDLIATNDKIDENKKLNICVIENYINECEEDVKKELLSAVEKLKAHGHNITYANLQDNKYDIAAYYLIACAEASANLSRYDGIRYGYRTQNYKNLNEFYENTRSEGFGYEVKKRILLGTFVLSSGYYDAYYLKAQKLRNYIKQKYDEILKDNDLIFMPVAPTKAFRFDAKKTAMQMYLEDIFTISVNLTGLGAISMPLAKKDGLNISGQFVGKIRDEITLLSGAKSLESILKS